MRAFLRKVLTDNGMRMRAVRGTLLTGFSFGIQNILRLAGNLVLTRLLFPEAFGLMAIVFVIISAIQNLSDLGINTSIVQDEEGDRPEFLDSAWMLQILRGGLVTVLVWLLAAPVAEFYDQPLLTQLLPVAGLAALIQGFNSTKLASSERELRLGRVTVLQIASQVIGLVATVLFTIWLRSIWALVLGYLIGAIAMLVLSHTLLQGHNNRFGFHTAYVRRILNFGTYIFFASMAGFLISQGDRAILGKLTSLEELALYNIAFFLASVPAMLARTMIDKVVFPLYSRRPPWESADNQRKIFQVRRIITGSGLVALMVFSLLGQPIIELLYDERYHGAGAFVVLIALALMPGVVTGSYMALALAAGDSKRFAIMAVGAAVTQTLCMVVGGIWFGVFGVAVGLALAPFLYYPGLILLIRPYRGWDPLHDIGFTLLTCGFIGIRLAQGGLASFFGQ